MDPGESSVLFRALPAHLRPTAGEKRQLKRFSEELADLIGGGRPFTCLITNDEQLRKFNREFLGHDYPTDVLSFPSGDGNGLGDLAISAERTAEQAEHFGHSRLDEYRLLILHGVLHLAGFDHENDRGEMARAERRWRAQLSLPDTLIDRASGVACKR